MGRGGGRRTSRLLEARHGQPVRYSYVPDPWPLSAYQTVFARSPGSAEMPSAARPFTPELVTELIAAGVLLATVTLHAGVASLEAGEPPLPEWFTVPQPTADLVNLTRAAGRRVVAVGTTSTRALESAAGTPRAARCGPAAGWTELVLGPGRPARVVTGLITGWHDAGASHLALLDAVAGPGPGPAAYRPRGRPAGYLWHEFGDSCLLLPPAPRRGSPAVRSRRPGPGRQVPPRPAVSPGRDGREPALDAAEQLVGVHRLGHVVSWPRRPGSCPGRPAWPARSPR